MADQGRRGMARNHDLMLEQGYEILPPEPLAVRGDDLALTRVRARTPGGDESVLLSLNELDDGRLVRSTVFDEDDLATALAELDERYLAAEGAEHLALLAAGQAWIAASRNEDVDALRAITAPGLVCVDHQPLGFGTLDREGLLAATRLRFELSADDVVIVRSVQIAGNAVLALHYAETTSESGGRYERAAWYLLAVDEAGLIERWEVFGEADGERALARLHELGDRGQVVDRSTAPGIENAATWLIAHTLDLMNRGDWAALEAMDVAAPDVVRFDRRRTVSAPTIEDSESFGTNAAGIYEVFGVVRPEPIAVRGDRLALIRLHCGDPPAFTMQMLVVYELDAAGRIGRESDFDEDQLDDALAELDERWTAGEGAEHEYLLRRLGDLVHAANSGNAASYRAMFHEDCTVANHRRLSFPMMSIDDVVASERATHDVGATRITRLPGIEPRGDAALLRQHERLVTSEGSEYATDMVLVVHQTAGRFDVIESYDPEDVDAARARFEELAIQRPTPIVDNHAVRINERFGWLAAHRGVDEARALLAPDLLAIDRRPGVAAPDMVGPDARLANLAAVVEVFDRIDHTNVAVRGERLMLLQWTISTAEGFATSGYDVTEIDETSRICRIVTFDADDLVGAIRELDARYDEIRTEPAESVRAVVP